MTLWMVRAERGALYDTFRQESLVALGWAELVDVADSAPKEHWIEAFQRRCPELKAGAIQSGVSQVLRFLRELKEGDEVLTYSPSLRTYLHGTLIGPARRVPEREGLQFQRPVRWHAEFARDRLGARTKSALGSTLSLFKVPEHAALEIGRLLSQGASAGDAPMAAGRPQESHEVQEAQEAQEVFEDVVERARQHIEDRLTQLDGYEMQAVVAGLLRAMGYKTRESPRGPDRGIDILASPDGLGFESPRIAVEVKHRRGATDAPSIRSFLGGRHSEDRGLYVSTGGFTKEARYEADRAKVPLMLWEMADVVQLLTEHYEELDLGTKQLVPLQRLYWPRP